MRYSLAALLLIAGSPAAATVDYAIDLTSPEHHSSMVTATFPTTSAAFLDVRMPAWRTGRYSILNLANGVSDFVAMDGNGRPLRWQKIDKSTWRVHLDRPAAVNVRYALYGNELGYRSRHIDDSHAYLDASAVLMYAEPYRGDDVRVSLKVPSGWQSFSGMESAGPHRFVAPNWDQLVDSPIETGINTSRRFKVGAQEYELVVWGKGPYDIDKMASDLGRIAGAVPAYWPTYPFKRYVWMVHATSGAGGATEHRNSTVIQLPRAMFGDADGYRRFIATAAHEFVHTWNVKAYRNAAMVPYDYQKENYTNLLWVEEGSTEYFSWPLLLRAGLVTPAEYFDELSGLIDGNQHRPGRTVQSVAQASWDEWISPADAERSQNAWVNIYSEGQIVSWMLDLALLQQTGGRVSYRDVHRVLYERFPSDRRGFTDADMLAVLQELTGQSWVPWWARHVTAPVTADFNALLNPVGLQLTYPDGPKAWAGWSGKAAERGIALALVERDSPAWVAGLGAGDTLVAIDGKPVGKIEDLLAGRKPGDVVTVSYLRRDETMEKRVTLGTTRGAPKVVPVTAPTAAQKALFERWLLVPYPKA
ncbi:M61 family metallopeptidase [Sphingomonas sabuli]|uniref:M61 family metallopeptidase n=1 Tax=Sphingomonas sabuli TaxID=2764186 RepID=A0A7G9L2N1_9SPHN|nr:PDZ domain-containing protein [Sphingomonas sabuli]QNM82880.1 M61 family metallopeptidase [Sphingomonas sabuli]